MIRAKRFWKEVHVRAGGSGFEVYLDTRKLLTPLKSPLILPSSKLAEQIALEWRALEGEIFPDKLPMTKRANSAIERVTRARAEVEAHLLPYVESDLLCYRAEGPEALIENQKAWDEWLLWARTFGIKLKTTTGIMPVEQPSSTVTAAQNWLSKWDNFQLVAIYDFITITGSFVLGQAIAELAIETGRAFDLARIDQIFQEEIWGKDEEATRVTENHRNELLVSMDYFLTLQG